MKTHTTQQTMPPIKKWTATLILVLLFGNMQAQQNYYLDTAVYTSTLNNQISSLNTNIQNGDSLIIRDTFFVNANLNDANTSIHFKIDAGGVLYFNSNSGITVGSESSFFFVNGGELLWVNPCNANKFIQIGPAQPANNKLASCIGGAAQFSFTDIQTSGYITGVGILPVEVKDFKAQQDQWVSQISFTSIFEIQCDYYVIEKSTDGTQWFELATLHAKGSESEETHYKHTDPNIEPINYYRLKQIDLDGKENTLAQTYLIALQSSKKQNKQVEASSLFPNPCNSLAPVILSSASDDPASIIVTDNLGTPLKLPYIQKGFNIEIHTENLPQGIYYITLQRNHETESHKLIKY